MRRSLSLLALLLVPFAGAALAQGESQPGASGLAAARGETLLKAAYETCLTLGGKGDAATEAFAAAGWDVATDDEAGFSEITGPEEISVLTWSDGGYCLVQSEITGSDRAADLLRDVIAASGQTALEQPGAEGCLTFDLAGGGPRAEVTSSGNDPVCTAPDTSGISFMWALTE